MKKSNFYLYVALFVTVLLPLFAYAQEAKIHTETTTKITRPLAIDGETNQVKPAVQRFIERINMARVALSTANPTEAKFNLDEAEKHLSFIRSNSNYQEVTKETVISSGQVEYDTNTKYNNYYVPLEEGPVVVKDYISTENQAGKANKKAIAVKSAKVVYLTLDLSGTKAIDALNQARAEIKDSNLTGADETLGKLLAETMTTKSVDAVPKITAQDNLKLALSSLEDNNYVAARFALTQAEEAVKRMQADVKYSGANVKELGEEIHQINDLVMQQTENTTQKARTEIKAVLADLGKLS